MDNIHTSTALQPMRIGQIMDRSLRLSKELLPKLIVLYVIMAAMQTAVQILPDMQLGDPFTASILVVGVSILQIIFGFALFLCVTFITAEHWLGNQLSVMDAFRRISFGLILRFIWLSIRIGFCMMFFLMLLIVPGIVYFVNRFLSYYVLLLEDTSTGDALRRSKTIMRHNPGKAWYSPSSPAMRLSGLMLILMLLQLIPGAIVGVSSVVMCGGAIDLVTVVGVGGGTWLIPGICV